MDRLSELEKRVEALENAYQNEHPVLIPEHEPEPEPEPVAESEQGFTEDAK